MGWASRANPTCGPDAVFVRSQIRAFLRRHPAQLKPLLAELGKPWSGVQAWMQGHDHNPEGDVVWFPEVDPITMETTGRRFWRRVLSIDKDGTVNLGHERVFVPEEESNDERTGGSDSGVGQAAIEPGDTAPVPDGP